MFSKDALVFLWIPAAFIVYCRIKTHDKLFSFDTLYFYFASIVLWFLLLMAFTYIGGITQLVFGY